MAAGKRKRKRKSVASAEGPTLEATESGIVVHFHRMRVDAFIGGAWPTIESCARCGHAAARVGASSWMHVGLMKLGPDNEPRIVSVESCGRVVENGVSARGLKSARSRVDNPPEPG